MKDAVKCAKCNRENARGSKFCSQCGAALAAAAPRPAAVAAETAPAEPFWVPDWRWHAKALAAIYVALAVVYFGLSAFLSGVKEPYRLRDIPPEMTPWLKK